MNRIFALWFVSFCGSLWDFCIFLYKGIHLLWKLTVCFGVYLLRRVSKSCCVSIKADLWKNPVANPVLQKQLMKVSKCHPSAQVPAGFPDEGRQSLCLEQVPEHADGWSSLTAKLLGTSHQQFGAQYGTCVKGSWDAGVGRDTTTSFCAWEQSQNFPGERDPPRVTALITAQHHVFASGRNYDICLKTCLFNTSNVISSSFKTDSFEALT